MKEGTRIRARRSSSMYHRIAGGASRPAHASTWIPTTPPSAMTRTLSRAGSLSACEVGCAWVPGTRTVAIPIRKPRVDFVLYIVSQYSRYQESKARLGSARLVEGNITPAQSHWQGRAGSPSGVFRTSLGFLPRGRHAEGDPLGVEYRSRVSTRHLTLPPALMNSSVGTSTARKPRF